MSPRQIWNDQKLAIEQATAESVNRAMQQLHPALKRKAWLRANRYEADVIGTLKNERRHSSHDSQQLTQYIAASVPLHCSDGWALMSQSACAFLCGDWANAIHLAYYAELRAAMAFLASEGVGIFNDYHVCIDQSSQLHPVRDIGTHRLVWKAMNHWASLNPHGTRLLSLVTVEGRSIDEWLIDARVSGSTRASLAEYWLSAWSLDLKVLSNDHELRNSVSYRPTRLQRARYLNVIKGLEGISQIWSACQPSSPGSLSVLDLHLLRLALETGYRGTFSKGQRAKSHHKSFVRHAAVSDGSLSEERANQLIAFLARETSPDDHDLLKMAGRQGTIGYGGALSVLARAALLLRVASASCCKHFNEAGITRADTQFWWDRYGVDHGLWDRQAPPDDFVELWDDVSDALQQAHDWCEQTRAQQPSTLRAQRDLSECLGHLWSFQRACLWTAGL